MDQIVRLRVDDELYWEAESWLAVCSGDQEDHACFVAFKAQYGSWFDSHVGDDAAAMIYDTVTFDKTNFCSEIFANVTTDEQTAFLLDVTFKGS